MRPGPDARVSQHVDDDELLALAQDLVRIPSISGDENGIARHLQSWLRDRDVAAELQEAAPGRPNVIARVPGRGHGKTLMLNGHTDMVAPLPDRAWDPWQPVIEDGTLYGAGISNMKGAIAAMAETMVAVARSGGLDGDIVLTAVVGECDQLGLGTKAALASGISASGAICGEPSLLGVTLCHAGVYQFRVVIEGRAAHQKEKHLGDNAIEGALHLFPLLDERALTFEPHEVLGAPSLVVGMIEGGVLPSITSPSCTLTGDVRIVPGMTRESVATDLERMVDRARATRPTLRARVEGFVYSPAFFAPTDAPIIRAVAEAHRRIVGRPIVMDRSRRLGVTDSSHLGAAGIQTALYGPGRWTSVEEREGIALDQLTLATRCYAETAELFCRAD